VSTILLISPEPWDGHFVSKHHYARELARRGHNVLFYGPPDATGPMRLVAVADQPGSLRVLHAPIVAPGLRFLPRSLRRTLEARWLRQVEQIVGHPIEVVWSFENSRFFDMGFAGGRLKIYQQVDLNQDFHPARAAATADLAIANDAPIEQRLAPVARHLIRITHGYAGHDMIDSVPDELEPDFACAPVNAVLIGNLDIAYLDVPLLTQLVADHLGTRFHFVGNYTRGQGLHGAVGQAHNTRFWGRQSAHALPAFLSCADVLLLTYLAGQHLDQLANPHKMMEYLAAGRCVLATRTLEYDDRPDLIETACDSVDYTRRFAAIVANPSAWNRPEQIVRRQDFARDNTYSRQVDRIAQAIGSRGRLVS
jgi:hypothetical protein